MQTFTQWLIEQDPAYENFVVETAEGGLEIRDGTLDDKEGTLQSVVSSQYGAWLQYLRGKYGVGGRPNDDEGNGVHTHPHGPPEAPGRPGVTKGGLLGTFEERESFTWLSGVSGDEEPVTHERFYFDSFVPAGETDPDDNGIVPIVGGSPSQGKAGGPTAFFHGDRFYSPGLKLAFDLDGAAGNTVKLLGAAFGKEYILPELVGIGLNLFDAGNTMEGVAGLALGTALYDMLVGSTSDVDFVDHVFENVVGATPAADVLEQLVGLLQGGGGTLTQAEFLALAANTDLNAQNIGLVGLFQSGVEFI